MKAPIRNAAFATILGAALAISATPALADHGQHRGWRNRDDQCEQSRGNRRDDRNADWRDRGDACRDDGYQGDVSWQQDDGYYAPQRVVVVERPVYVPVVPRHNSGLTISLSGLFGGNPFSAHVEHHPVRQTPVTYRSWANNAGYVRH